MGLDKPASVIRACLEAQPGAVGEPLPSAPGVVLYKVMGKMFAVFETRRVEGVILKCDPHLADVMRQQYVGVGHRSHLDRRYWINIDLNADVPIEEVERLVSHSHEQVCAKLTRKQKAELQVMISSKPES